MPISLYDAFVPSCLQIIGAVRGLAEKAEAFCPEKGLTHEEIIGSCLIEDMLPFAYQVKSVAVHSLGAIDGVRAGLFTSDMTPPPTSFADLRAKLLTAEEGLRGVTTEEGEGFICKPVHFSIPGRNFKLDFKAENFLLSFSQPNFYFHAVTAYDILRHKGVPLGKRDFLGALRIEIPA